MEIGESNMGSQAEGPQSWRRISHQLRFRVGYFTIWRLRLTLMACGISPSVKKTRLEDLLLDELPKGVHGYLITGFPAPEPRPTLTKVDEFYAYTSLQYTRYFVMLQTSFEEYSAGFKGKTRSTIRRKIKKFAEHNGGEQDFRIYKLPEEIDEFFDLALFLSATTYQERLLNAGLPSGTDYREQLRRKAMADEFRGYILFHESKPVSYMLLNASGSVLSYDHLGFDPSYSKWSVGTVLHWLAFEDLFSEQRFDLLDFTEGEGQHKQQFSTDSSRCATVYLLRRTPANYAIVRTHAFCVWLSKTAVRVSARLGIKQKIRVFLRRT
jgi:hypothetical protein